MDKEYYILWIASLIFIFYLFYFAKNNLTFENFSSQEPSSVVIQTLPKGIVAMNTGEPIFRLYRKQIGENKNKLVLYDSLHKTDLDVIMVSDNRNEIYSIVDGSRCVVYAKSGGFFGETYRNEEVTSQISFDEGFTKKNDDQILTKVIIKDEVDNSELAVIEKRRDNEWELMFTYGVDRNIVALSLLFFYEMEKEKNIQNKYYGV